MYLAVEKHKIIVKYCQFRQFQLLVYACRGEGREVRYHIADYAEKKGWPCKHGVIANSLYL